MGRDDPLSCNYEQDFQKSAPCFALTWPEQTITKKVPVLWSKEQIHNVFKSCDRNGDGKLSKEELKAAFKKLGSCWSSYRARSALRHADANRDGIISSEELNELINYALECGYKI